MEADYPVVVLLNILRTLNDLDCCWTFYKRDENDQIITNKKGEPLTCEYPRQKFQQLRIEAEKAGSMIGTILERLWEGDLRNSFSHSQYAIGSNGSITATKMFTGVPTRRSIRNIQNCRISYSSVEIEQLYEGAMTYLDSFVREYKKFIQPYQDEMPHRIQDGLIRWSNKHKRWACVNNNS